MHIQVLKVLRRDERDLKRLITHAHCPTNKRARKTEGKFLPYFPIRKRKNVVMISINTYNVLWLYIEPRFLFHLASSSFSDTLTYLHCSPW